MRALFWTYLVGCCSASRGAWPRGSAGGERARARLRPARQRPGARLRRAVLLALLGQAVAGAARYGEQQAADGMDRLSLWEYVRTSDFAVDVAENWQSEYLQFLLFIGLTVWLVQRGSPESKRLDEVGRGSDEEQLVGRHARADSPSWVRAGGWRTRVYSHSLLLVMGLLFALSWLAQSVAGWATYGEEQLRQRTGTVSWLEYLMRPDL